MNKCGDSYPSHWSLSPVLYLFYYKISILQPYIRLQCQYRKRTTPKQNCDIINREPSSYLLILVLNFDFFFKVLLYASNLLIINRNKKQKSKVASPCVRLRLRSRSRLRIRLRQRSRLRFHCLHVCVLHAFCFALYKTDQIT